MLLPLASVWCSAAALGGPLAQDSRAAEAYQDLVAGFHEPPARARPDAFWAWLNGHADPARITEEMEAFRAAGFSRLQVWDVKAHRDPGGIVPVGPAFLSDEWLVNLAHADREAQRLGLELGLVAASGWNAGGTWVDPSRAGLSLFCSSEAAMGPAALDVQLAFPRVPEHAPRGDDGRPAYWATVAVQAVPISGGSAFDPARVIDLSGHMDAAGRVRVELPAGEWELRWFVRANSGQRLIVPSPNSDGLQIDFFDASDSRWYFQHVLDRLESALGPLEDSALRYLEVDSLELEGSRLAAWTEEILASFASRYGYDATPWLTLLMQPERADSEGSRFLHDWTRHVSDLMIENHYRLGNELLGERGLLLSAEAGGPGPPIWSSCPVDAIGALGATGMMRGEFWPKQRSMYNVKEIACAAHTYGQPIVDAESFTSWRHWRDLPYYLKLLADQAFVDGLNHITFHTAPHGGGESGLPGYAYHAGTHMGPNLAWWSMARPFIAYLSRCSFLLQEGVHVADVCFYQGAGAPVFHPLGVDWDASVRPLGYDYDVIDVRQLVGAMTVEEGRLRLPSGASYRVLVLPDADEIDPAALTKIAELVRGGATVVGRPPVRAAGRPPLRGGDGERGGTNPLDARVRRLAVELWGGAEERRSGDRQVGLGTVIQGTPLHEVLSRWRPDFTWVKGDARTRLGFVHRRDAAGDIYFVVNHNERQESVEGVFRVEGCEPKKWDPATGEITPLGWQVAPGGCTRVGLQLSAGGTCFVVFRRDPGLPTPREILHREVVRVSDEGADVAHGDAPNGPAWVSSGEREPAEEFIVYDLARVVSLQGLEVWNYQDQVRGLLTRGVRDVAVSASLDGLDYAPIGSFPLRRAPDIGERGHQERLSFEPTEARFVRLEVASNYSDDWSGHTRYVGLNRVAFLDGEGLPLSGVRLHQVSSGTAHHPSTDLLRARPDAGVTLDGPWTLRFPKSGGGPGEVRWDTLRSWTTSDVEGIRHFSGVAEYTTRFSAPDEVPAAGRQIQLDLGRLAGVARVFLNGQDLGVVWKPPYAVDVTESLAAGVNDLRCEVANTWHNRLVGDAARAPADRITLTNIRAPFQEGTPLLEAGILGPVRLTVSSAATSTSSAGSRPSLAGSWARMAKSSARVSPRRLTISTRSSSWVSVSRTWPKSSPSMRVASARSALSWLAKTTSCESSRPNPPSTACIRRSLRTYSDFLPRRTW